MLSLPRVEGTIVFLKSFLGPLPSLRLLPGLAGTYIYLGPHRHDEEADLTNVFFKQERESTTRFT